MAFKMQAPSEGKGTPLLIDFSLLLPTNQHLFVNHSGQQWATLWDSFGCGMHRKTHRSVKLGSPYKMHVLTGVLCTPSRYSPVTLSAPARFSYCSGLWLWSYLCSVASPAWEHQVSIQGAVLCVMLCLLVYAKESPMSFGALEIGSFLLLGGIQI